MENVLDIARHFGIVDVAQTIPYGSGHINDTYAVTLRNKDERVLLQRINKSVFTRPDCVMHNVLQVTAYVQERIREQGGDPRRESLNLLPSDTGDMYYVDGAGDWWRAYDFIEGTECYDTIECADDLYRSGVAFGSFTRTLIDFPADKLHETIPHFHDTPHRYRDFDAAVAADIAGRACGCGREIELARGFRDRAGRLMDMLADGRIPLRVTHNDTKLNNVLFDVATHAVVCVIDLDTVMPGLVASDFGDAIRCGASTSVEDETDLSKVSLDLALFEAFARGYLEGCGDVLTPGELESLVLGAPTVAVELGVRFLSDHLNGDTYFKIHRENHNLDRARAQLALACDMEKKLPQMREIIYKLSEECAGALRQA